MAIVRWIPAVLTTVDIRLKRRAPAALTLLAWICSAPPLRAGVVLEETHALAPGWNFIHLAIDPLVKDPRLALGSIDWDSLWAWLPDAPGAAAGNPQKGSWVSLHRDAPAFVSSLQQIAGPASYALQMRSAGVLRIQGWWRPDRQPLRGEMYQLYSPKVPAAAPPDLAGYLSRPGTQSNISAVYEHSGNVYRKVNGADPLRAGASYWVLADQDLPAIDPLRIRAGFGGLHFDARTPLQEMEIDLGAGAAPRQLRLTALPGAGEAGPFDWLEVQLADGSFTPLAGGITLEIPAEQSAVRFIFRASSPLSTQAGGALKTAILEAAGAGGSVLVGAELDVPEIRGIWIGEAVVNEVERLTQYGSGFAPSPALSISLILEVPEAGPARLLTCAELAARRDGRELRYRFQAAHFHETVDLVGAIGPNGKTGTLRGTAAMGADDPLNPYRHRYHPEHTSGYELQRDLTLRFGATPSIPPNGQNPLDTIGSITGVYEEEIHGLSRQPIRVRGGFRLRGLASDAVQPCEEAGQ